jgi:hypothetical protein
MPSPSTIRKAIMQRQKRKGTPELLLNTDELMHDVPQHYFPSDCLCGATMLASQSDAYDPDLDSSEAAYDPEAIECPVCMDAKPESKFLGCPNDHLVCIECLRNPTLIQDHGICDCPNPYCTGFKWTCPLCRVHCSLDRGHALAVMQGDNHILNCQPYPTVFEVIDKMQTIDQARFDACDDELIYEAISDWDYVFSNDSDWFNEEDTDLKDALRDEVEEELHGSFGWVVD